MVVIGKLLNNRTVGILRQLMLIGTSLGVNQFLGTRKISSKDVDLKKLESITEVLVKNLNAVQREIRY